jgi:hypothetical protein
MSKCEICGMVNAGTVMSATELRFNLAKQTNYSNTKVTMLSSHVSFRLSRKQFYILLPLWVSLSHSHTKN